ncbi:MAG: alginate lyase family protein, partial [Roseobacter sp.]|nr:alginate lyase family protein [Roseobacter sp.]
MDEREDTFALCRIIGNDLEPRHAAGQSLKNVRFILDHEPDFEGVKKLWVVNRIFNKDTEAAILALLEERGQTYRRIPFNAEEYQAIGFDFTNLEDKRPFYNLTGDEEIDSKQLMNATLQAFKDRNNYVMNNNGARNTALSLCFEHAKWGLPFDGNCFFTEPGWSALRSDILAARGMRYFTVPMARVTNNEELLDPNTSFSAEEEPQMVFRSDALLRFSEDHCYGRRPKVELFLHLGIDGPWSNWPCEHFDTPPRQVHSEGHRVGRAGWVARLNSGKQHLEVSNQKALIDRGLARSTAIRATLEMLEARQTAAVIEQGRPPVYDMGKLQNAAQEVKKTLQDNAREALTRGPFSVTQKPEPGPSGDLHDYYHPAPYWWPNPKTPDGLPYVWKDGERFPGTELFKDGNERFDRTRLQHLFDDTTALALGSMLPAADASFRAHGLKNIQTWFLDPETAMSPALEYAQVRMGHGGNQGAASGLIESKDFYYFLDAVRILDDPDTTAGMQDWCARFLTWFTESKQGKTERKAHNNHGTCHDLQAAAHAAFLGRVDVLQHINFRAQARALQTITPEGDQPHEMERTLTQHYCAFNLQCWVNLFNLLTGVGFRPWESEAGERIRVGLRRLLILSHDGWTGLQIKPFDEARLLPLSETLRNQTGETLMDRDVTHAPECFHPDCGIP